jgi:hypothetical protein
MDALIATLLKLGAPWVMTAILLVLFVAERKRKDDLADKLYDLGLAQVKKDTEVHTTLELVRKDVEEIRRFSK